MELTAELHQVEPDIEPIDFEGAHLILHGALAFFWRLFARMGCEEEARRELYPWLLQAKKNGFTTPDKAVRCANPEKGLIQ